MQHFQPILIAIGILAIAGVLIHGFLLNRKEKLALKAEQDELIEEQNIDENNIDEEQVQFSESNASGIRDYDNVAFSSHLTEQPDENEDFNFTIDDEQPVKSVDVENHTEQIPTELITHIDQIQPMQEPVTERQTKVPKNEPVPEQEKKPQIIETDLFIFNLAAKGEERLGGHELLQFFLTSGFRFGDMNIFHRHEHSNGTGEVLFSIANMMAPGTFDLDTIEQFNSPGISFFFTAPNDKISVNKSFDMMLRAVEQFAEEFDCEVLNEQRKKFTHEEFIEYRTRLEKYQ